jgi:hypothetical protein
VKTRGRSHDGVKPGFVRDIVATNEERPDDFLHFSRTKDQVRAASEREVQCVEGIVEKLAQCMRRSALACHDCVDGRQSVEREWETTASVSTVFEVTCKAG